MINKNEFEKMTDERKQFYKNMTDEEIEKTINKIENIVKVEKKYSGRGGWHGGGRPKKGPDARRKTMSISGTPAEIEELQRLAEDSGKTVSRFIIESLINFE